MWHFMLPEMIKVAQLSFHGEHVSETWHFIVDEICKKLHEKVCTAQVQCNVEFYAP